MEEENRLHNIAKALKERYGNKPIRTREIVRFLMNEFGYSYSYSYALVRALHFSELLLKVRQGLYKVNEEVIK